jgi:hypothetical protein
MTLLDELGRGCIRFTKIIQKVAYVATVPYYTLVILQSRQIDRSYSMSTVRKLRLGWSMFFNCLRIPTGTNYRAHLLMARRILETPPDIQGDVIECGT